VIDLEKHAAQLLNGEIDFFTVHPDGIVNAGRKGDIKGALLVPGSFNPLHLAHCQLYDRAEMLEGNATFELSAFNVDKPPIDISTMLNRLSQFAGTHSSKISIPELKLLYKSYYLQLQSQMHQLLFKSMLCFLLVILSWVTILQ
jgi:hypothetical protein